MDILASDPALEVLGYTTLPLPGLAVLHIQDFNDRFGPGILDAWMMITEN